MTTSTKPERLVLLRRDTSSETWLTQGDWREALRPEHARRIVSQAFHAGGPVASTLCRVTSATQQRRGASARGRDATWSVLEAALLRGHLTVHVLARPIPTVSGVRNESQLVPNAPQPSSPPIEDERSLYILRCDPELTDDAPLAFEYLTRGLSSRSVKLRILSSRFPGEVVHERPLRLDETVDRVHQDSWDGIVTAACQYQGKRLPAEYGPCTLEIVHDQTHRDTAVFTLSRAVEVITLDGFFHTGSAMFLPSRRARGGEITPQPFQHPEQFEEWRGSELVDDGPRFDEAFEFSYPYELRDTVGLTLLAHILFECADSRGQRGLILAGHANAVGSNVKNDELADARARCVWSILTGDAAGFELALEDFWVIEDAYVLARYCGSLYGWPCDPGDPRGYANTHYSDAIRCFQQRYNEAFDANIDVDGDVGPQTRGAFLDVYQVVLAGALGGAAGVDDLRERLRVHGSAPTLSAGERYPASARRPGAGIDDRRVEALLFLPDEPVPADAAAIYEYDTFRFVEWSPSTNPATDAGELEPVLEPVEPAPERSEGGELKIYEPYDPEDPWDFLNAFTSVTNHSGVRHE